MRVLVGFVAVLLLAAYTGHVAAQEKIDAKKLIGKWQPADSAKGVDVTLEFTDKGKMIIAIALGDKSEKIEGTYKLTGDQLEMVMSFGGKEQKETVTLTKLTDEEMAGKSKDGKEEKFKRVKAK
jgi:uncharacterized protein (TIGR03066 family)